MTKSIQIDTYIDKDLKATIDNDILKCIDLQYTNMISQWGLSDGMDTQLFKPSSGGDPFHQIIPLGYLICISYTEPTPEW